MAQNPNLFKHGNNWCFRYWKDAQRKFATVCPIEGPGALDKHAREGRKLAVMIELGLVANEIPETVKNVITIKAAGDSWLHQSMTRRRKPIRQNTARIYGHYLARWIYPAVGEMLLSEFKSMQAKQVVDSMDAVGASTSVINDVITIMQQIVESVKDADGQPLYNVKLDRNVMDAPEVQQTEMKAFDGEQIEKVNARTNGQYKVLFDLLASTGLRISEALAIEIGANNETTTTLSNDCCVLCVQTIILQDGTKQDAPKTNAGVREVDIHPTLPHN